ncbi:MAG TPA: hypothetical protein VMS37_10070 [Verrucomicrobiae bacterium]|nr:hypothetical protein [Verrucomicrobiae bacterium]
MVSFRRLATAVALLAVFAALAGAQGLPLTCQTNVAVTPTLRAEGYTEQTGDITISCTGGALTAAGSLIPQVNVTLFYNTAVTSRLLPTSASSAISEALLLVDEPGSGISFVNPNQVLCPTPTTGCQEYVNTGTQPFTGATGPIYGQCTTFTGATCTGFGAINTIPNVYQGIVSGNAITFFGVPFLAPTTSGSRVLRITNARVNATQLSGGSAAGATPVIASISISGATSLSISNATPTVGFVQGGLTASASSASNQNQCATQTKTSINTLTFTENFPTAFKTRVFAQTNVSYAGQGIPGSSGLLTQNIPGSIYNSESNFVYGVSSTQTAGLADFGTRLRATFNNVPAGVRLFVSTVNVNNNASPIAAPAIVGGNVQTQVYAQLVSSETIADGNAGTSGFFPAVTATDNGPNGGNVPIAEIQVVNGSASAVWEVVNTNPNANESVKFAVYTTYISNVGQNSPPPGTATVNLSFAPAPPTFSASSGAAASSTLTIPRFIADPNAARNILIINICRTILLYPYVTNQAGFDTGLAIANTSTDPFGTSPQAGSCALNWYQGTNNPAQQNSGTIASGTVYTTLASTAVPGFQGYMIAVCNFQFAHGFAFISDVGARNLAMGYLAVVIADPGTGSRTAQPGGCIGVSGCNTAGEQGAH